MTLIMDIDFVVFLPNDLRTFGFVISKRLNGNSTFVSDKDLYCTINYDAASQHYEIVQHGKLLYAGKIGTLRYAEQLFDSLGLM